MKENATSKDVGLRELTEMAHGLSRAKGWYEGGERNIPEMLALIHSEVSEALEEYRNDSPHFYLGEKNKPEGIAAELADVVIRVADLCGHLGIDLADAVATKHAYNATRPHRHGGKRC